MSRGGSSPRAPRVLLSIVVVAACQARAGGGPQDAQAPRTETVVARDAGASPIARPEWRATRCTGAGASAKRCEAGAAFERGDVALARKLADEALARAQKELRANDPALAWYLHLAGVLQAGAGQLGLARTTLGRALARAEKLRREEWLVMAHDAAVLDAERPGPPSAAAAAFAERRRQAARDVDPDYAKVDAWIKDPAFPGLMGKQGATIFVGPLAGAQAAAWARIDAHFAGEYDEAAALGDLAFELAASHLPPDSPKLAWFLDVRAEGKRFLDEYDEARTDARRALEISEAEPKADQEKLCWRWKTYADLVVEAGDLEDADRAFGHADEAHQRAGLPHDGDYAHLLQDWAALDLMRGRPPAAEGRLRRVTNFTGLKLLDRWYPLRLLGDTLAFAHKYAEAAEAYQRSVVASRNLVVGRNPMPAERPQLDHLSRGALAGLAAVAEAQGDHARSLAWLARTFTGSGHEEDEVDGAWQDRTDQAVTLHLRARSPATAELALSAVVRLKGRALEAAYRRRMAMRRVLDPDARATFAKLEAAQSALAAASLGPKPPDHAVVRGLRREADYRTALLEAAAKPYLEPVPAASGADVARAVPGGGALVEFYRYRPFRADAARPQDRFAPPRYVAFVLRAAAPIEVIELDDAAATDAEVEELRRALATPATTDSKERGHALYRRLFARLDARLAGAEPVLVAPDGALHRLPFGALVDDQGLFLVERFVFSELPSGRDLVRPAARAPRRAAAVVIADPDYGHSNTWPALPGTEREAQRVAARLHARTLTRASATESAVKALHGPRILHVASHGFVHGTGSAAQGGGRGAAVMSAGSQASSPRDANPSLLGAGLILAGGGAKSRAADDGVLTALEVSGLDLYGTQLVVLSACETGLGELRGAEGVYGLQRAFALAGAESVVMSLWKIADEETGDLMDAYYEALPQAGRAGALASAQRRALRAPKAHPYYWAAFVTSGRWDSLEARPAAEGAPVADAGTPSLARVSWRAKVPPKCWPGALARDGVVLVACEDGTLEAFDQKTGQPRWSHHSTVGFVHAPAIAAGLVYAGESDTGGKTGDGGLTALDLRTGVVRWRWQQPRLSTASDVLVHGEAVVVGVTAGGSRLQALDARTGKPLWSRPDGASSVYARPQASGGAVFYAHGFIGDHVLAALSVSGGDGAPKWSQPVPDVQDMLFVEDTLYVLVETKRAATFVRAIAPATGAVKWEHAAGVGATRIGAGGRLLVVQGPNGLSLHDRATGAVQWSVTGFSEDSMFAGPTLAGDLVLWGDAAGVHGARVDSGERKVLKVEGEPFGAIAVDGGRAFAVTDRGWLYAFE